MELGVTTREEEEYQEELARQRDALYRLLEADLAPEYIHMLQDLLEQVKAGYGLTRFQGLQLKQALRYSPIPGENIPIPPGPRLKCPLCDYKIYRQGGQSDLP